MEWCVLLGLLLIIVITVIIGIAVNVIDKQDTERLHEESEAKKKLRQRSLAHSLSLIYVFNNRNLSATFNKDDFHYHTARFQISFADISELQDEGFIKAVTLPHFNYDNNGIYKYTTPAQYQITESGAAFLKRNYKGSSFEDELNKQQALEQMSAEELQIEAAKKAAIEKQEVQKRIKQLEAKIKNTEQEQQDLQRNLQNRQNMLTWWAINNHYNRHK